jgi:hypothetical protein
MTTTTAPLAPLVLLAGSWPGLDDAARLAALDAAIGDLYAARRALVAEVVADERGRYPHGVLVRAAARLGISRQSVGRIAGREEA